MDETDNHGQDAQSSLETELARLSNERDMLKKMLDLNIRTNNSLCIEVVEAIKMLTTAAKPIGEAIAKEAKQTDLQIQTAQLRAHLTNLATAIAGAAQVLATALDKVAAETDELEQIEKDHTA